MRRTNRQRQLTVTESLKAFNAKRYLDTGYLPANCDPEVILFAKTFADAAQERYSIDMLQKQMQYAALQSQINPHFLYNTLEAIRSEALLRNCNDIAEMTEKLSRFFRYSISSKEDFVPLREELFNLKDYFFIQQYRFDNRYTLTINVEDEALLDCYCPKMTVQPLAENAIFHGLEKKKGGGNVCVRIRGTAQKIYLTVSDNGVGIDMIKVEQINQQLQTPWHKLNHAHGQRHGMALTNVSGRIRIYFGEEYGLRINSVLGQGTDAELILPRMDELAFNRFKTMPERGWMNIP